MLAHGVIRTISRVAAVTGMAVAIGLVADVRPVHAEGEGKGGSDDVTNIQPRQQTRTPTRSRTTNRRAERERARAERARERTERQRRANSERATPRRAATPAPAPTTTRRTTARPATPRRAAPQRRVARTAPARARPTVPSGLPPAGEDRFLDNQVIVRYFLDANQGQMNALVGGLALRHEAGRTFQLAGTTVHLYTITNGAPVRTVIQSLEADNNVASAQPNYLYELAQSSGGDAGGQYALAKFDIDSVHALTKGGAVPVAVIDSGIDASHPELASVALETIDAVGTDAPADSHGTSIAGIIAAQGALRGIAPEVRLIGVRAFAPAKAGASARSTSWRIADSLDRSHKAGAQILNMSFAGPQDPLVGESVAGAQKRGMVAIAAAGNGGPDSKPAYPAAYPGVIAVTATDQNDAAYTKANQGDYISVAAPGVGILAPVPNGGYEITSGTSMAAAHVSALVALMVSRKGQLSGDAIRQKLADSAVDLGSPGADPIFGAGLPNAMEVVGGTGT